MNKGNKIEKKRVGHLDPKQIWENVLYIIEGLAVVAEDDDPELWDNPRKKARIRRRMARRERRRHGKKADV